MYAFLDRKMEQLPVRRQPMSLSSQTGLVILEKLHESGSKYLTMYAGRHYKFLKSHEIIHALTKSRSHNERKIALCSAVFQRNQNMWNSNTNGELFDQYECYKLFTVMYSSISCGNKYIFFLFFLFYVDFSQIFEHLIHAKKKNCNVNFYLFSSKVLVTTCLAASIASSLILR